jgi:hypothetical protein
MGSEAGKATMSMDCGQWYMQLRGEHPGSAQQVRRKRKGALGRFFLTKPGERSD